jgi:hypothetical protein
VILEPTKQRKEIFSPSQKIKVSPIGIGTHETWQGSADCRALVQFRAVAIPLSLHTVAFLKSSFNLL